MYNMDIMEFGYFACFAEKTIMLIKEAITVL